MASSTVGNAKNLEQLDAIDRATHARFVAGAGNASEFLWPDAELNARLGRKKQKQERDSRRKDNDRRLERLETSAAVALQSQAPSFTWADGVRERELRGHEARVASLSIDGALLVSKDSSDIVKVWDLRSAVHAQAAAGNAEANELMDRDAMRNRASRKRNAEAAAAGDEAAQQRRATELERIETRLPEHSAASRRERRVRVGERACAAAVSTAMRDAAELQRANERDRGRQRREK